MFLIFKRIFLFLYRTHVRLKTAGIGIAMGNANSMVKEASDYTTLSVDEDGIYHALKHWNII